MTTTSTKPFTYKNIEALPKPPYVRKYLYPLMHTQWLFVHKSLDDVDCKDDALVVAKQWLDETNHSGYLVWTDNQITPVNRKGIIIDDDYKRWN